LANPQRGEVEVTLQGRPYKLRITHEGLAETEDKAGIGICGMAIRLESKSHGFRDVAAMVYGGLRGAGNFDFTFEQVRDQVLKEGVRNYHTAFCQLVMAAMRGIGTEEVLGKKKEEEVGGVQPT
jgi:hypothetical protein